MFPLTDLYMRCNMDDDQPPRGDASDPGVCNKGPIAEDRWKRQYPGRFYDDRRKMRANQPT